jgi:5-methylcytosine-specific restriction endonuclease McrA
MNKNGKIIKCINCGKEFYLPKCRLPKNNEHRYCSSICQAKYKSKLTISKYSKLNNINNMKDWLFQKYVIENKTFRDIMKLLGIKNNRLINNWLNYYNIQIRHGSEAINAGWLGQKGNKRKRLSKYIANTYLNSKIARDKLRKTMQTVDYRKKCRLPKLGENNPNYNPNLSEEERNQMYKDKRDDRYWYWRRKVYERDHFTCQITGIKKSGDLVAHHLNSYNLDKENRFNVDNGITILKEIHKLFHHYYGYGNNTKEQFKEFIERFANHEFDKSLEQIF